MVAPAENKLHVRAAAAILVLAALLAYANTFAVPFLFDDKAAVLDNPSIRQLWPLTAVLSPPPEASGAAGRPVVNLSLALNYATSGENVWSYHAFNLLAHAAAGLALFGFLRRLPPTAPLPVTFIIALLWLVHPLQTESVTSVIQRSESIVSLFYLLTLYCFVRAASSPQPQPRLWLGLSVAACAAGMASKELMVTAPVLVLLCDRTFFAGSFRAALQTRRLYYAGLAATWLVLAWLLLRSGGSRGEAAGFGLGVTPWDYLLTQCRALVLYLKLSVWPDPLVLDYGTAIVRDPLTVLPQGLLLLALAGATLWACVRRPAVGFAGAAFFLMLAPSSSVVPLVAQTIAEHRMYLALAAVLALPAVFFVRRFGRPALVAALLLAVIFIGLTLQRNRDYRSELAAWSDTVAKIPDNPRARINLAEAHLLAGDAAAALPHAAEAVRLRPDYPEAQMNLAIAIAQTGRPDDALAPAREAVRLHADSLRAQSNLGTVLAMLGHFDEACVHLRRALELGPASAEALSLHGNLGYALRELGRREEAAEQFRAMLRLDPAHAGARAALAKLGYAPR